MSERHKFNGICDHAEDEVCPHYEESMLRDSDKCSECGYWNPDCKESE